jgi:hypothetical protein
MFKRKSMEANVYFVVAIDADPDPVDSPLGANDNIVLKKYHLTLDIIKNLCHGKGVISVHTSPRYRIRFLKSPFIEFWRQWTGEGGDLMLHPEEDLYSTRETRLEIGTYYNFPEHMEKIISDTVDFMKGNQLVFAAFRGAFFGFTHHILNILKKVELSIDLSCAPGIEWPEKSAGWSNAPVSGYYMSEKSYCKPVQRTEKGTIFEIPLGWDGRGNEISHNYLFNERSTYKRMCKVWDTIVDRSIDLCSPQFVHFLFHTYAMSNKNYRHRCKRFIEYMQTHGGIPVTPSEAKNLFDGN